MLTQLTQRLIQILTDHKDLPWNRPANERAKMAPELRIVAELFDELSQRQGWSPERRRQSLQSVLTAAQFIALHGVAPIDEVLTNTAVRDRAFRSAARKLHPDSPGGDVQLFRELMAHREILRTVENI